ncbi:hypothetical protein glysoja_001597 [Glycine soja]|nr:hypothetical protein glysoja_001597 [Glycine soja]
MNFSRGVGIRRQVWPPKDVKSHGTASLDRVLGVFLFPLLMPWRTEQRSFTWCFLL